VKTVVGTGIIVEAMVLSEVVMDIVRYTDVVAMSAGILAVVEGTATSVAKEV
jgi:hypothetical protein